ncbi:MAG: hypothetical protein U0807_05575 [Candidatus Binatia bacterium]
MALAVIAAFPSGGRASCDVLPSPPLSFHGALGAVDRPFARPGDWLLVTLDARCDGSSPGFTAASAAHVVTIVFRAPQGERNVVVLADDCAAVETQRQACAARSGVSTATCAVARRAVPDGAGGFTELPEILRLDDRQLRFRFPDSDPTVAAPAEGLGLTGPAAVAVTTAGDPLPCQLAAEPCRSQTGLLACIDTLASDAGGCSGPADPTFPSFTALPPSNDYEAICRPDPATTSPCDGTQDEIRFTVDAAGNVLVPVDWRGVLFREDLVPVLRLVRASSAIEAYPGRGAPIRIPDLGILKSFSPGGKPLPPLFDPLSEPGTSGPVTFFGSADAPETVLRIARHERAVGQCSGGSDAGLPCLADGQCPGATCRAPACTGGERAGLPCATDGECPGGECGPGLFDFGTRLAFGRGPVVLRQGACIGGAAALAACAADGECPGGQCGRFDLTALDPVPLDGLNQSEALNAFVLEEALENRDLNGDGDVLDHVVRLGDRSTGTTRPIGEGGAEGRAIARIQRPPFSFPALALEGDVLAFLEPEPLQGGVDRNGDGDVADTLLRVFRLDGTEVTAGLANLLADGAPLVNGRPVVVSGGKVVFRSWEAARARQKTERVNVSSSGVEANAFSTSTGISADGRFVAFDSDADNLVPGDTNGTADVFVRDRVRGTTERASVKSNGEQSSGFSYFPAGGSGQLSANGRFVAFGSDATDLGAVDPDSIENTFVHDRLTGVTEMVALNSQGVPGNGLTHPVGISTDGRFVAMSSYATNLVPGDTNGAVDLFVRDRVTGITTRESVASDGTQGNGHSFGGTLSGDGRFAAFYGVATTLVPDDTNGDGTFSIRTDPGQDVFVRDRLLGTTERVSLDSDGRQSLGRSNDAKISLDGRSVAFDNGGALVPGDTNGAWDSYVRDRIAGTTVRPSVDSSGRQGHAPNDPLSIGSFASVVSGDGRFVAYYANAGSLAGEATTERLEFAEMFLHDTVTQMTSRVSLAVDGGRPNAHCGWPSGISADGRYVVMCCWASNLVPNDTNETLDVFVRGPDLGDCGADLTGDCDLADTVLQVLDTATGAVQTLCPAGQTAVAGGRIAFLRPEAAGDAPGCPPLPPHDAAVADGRQVVHFWDGGAVSNLDRAATWVGLSDWWLAALVDESAQGARDLNGDRDTADTVVQVHAASGSGSWTNLGRAADFADLRDRFLAFLTPERAQGNADLNGDGDAEDRVVHVFEAGTGSPVRNTTQAAEELVVGPKGLVAFRTREAAQGRRDLNGDGDTRDDVLQVWDPETRGTLATGQAVTPCRLEACDPRLPYRVLDDTVTFLTLEADQAADLNRDGDQDDLVLQILNVRQAIDSGTSSGAIHTLAATTAGVCTSTGAACATNRDCAQGTCFVPPGGCIRDTGVACVPAPSVALGTAGPCPAGQFCQPLLGQPGAGICRQVEGPCQSTAECTTGATCSLDDRTFNRIVNPLLHQGGGAVVFSGAGRCVETTGSLCTVRTDCRHGEFCDGGYCRREHGSCTTSADCPPAAACQPEIATQTAADSDGDELPDAIDNCPTVPNIRQEDADGDGHGDACDAETCGNGVREGGEACDGADAGACAGGCSRSCTCPCATVLDGPQGPVRLEADGGSSRLTAHLVLPLDTYDDQPVSVRVDGPTRTLVARDLGRLPRLNPRHWRFTTRAPGLRLVDFAQHGRPGSGVLWADIWATDWASPAGSPEPPATLVVTIGGRCFAAPVTVRARGG